MGTWDSLSGVEGEREDNISGDGCGVTTVNQCDQHSSEQKRKTRFLATAARHLAILPERMVSSHSIEEHLMFVICSGKTTVFSLARV